MVIIIKTLLSRMVDTPDGSHYKYEDVSSLYISTEYSMVLIVRLQKIGNLQNLKKAPNLQNFSNIYEILINSSLKLNCFEFVIKPQSTNANRENGR